jgi:4-hydroxybenzoate polyprenyltransferase
MRLYLAFIPLSAAAIGFYLTGRIQPSPRAALLAAIVFFGWGVHQVVNDLTGIEADKVNAPKRPICSSTLDKRFAVSITSSLALAGFLISLVLSRPAGVVYIGVFAVNLIYDKLKKLFLGNAAFAALIALCVYYGAFGSKNGLDAFSRQKLLLAALCVGVINFTFAFLTDFKDEIGDKAVGVKNIVTVYGLVKARQFIPFYLGAQFFAVLIFFKSAGRPLSLMVYPALLMAAAAAIFSLRDIYKSKYSTKWPLIEVILLQTAMLLA